MKRFALAVCAAFMLSTSPVLAHDDDDDDRRHKHRYEHHHDGDYHHHKKKHRHHWKKERHAHHGHYKRHRHHGHRGHDHGWHRHDGYGWHGHPHKRKHKKAKKRVYVEKHVYHHHPKKRRHGGHYGHRHGHHHGHGHGYKRRHDDRDWALFAILALQIVDVLNESQRHSYVLAQKRATQAPLGETIRWNDGSASGQLVPLRDGSDSAGRYCREFQQEITVGNQRRAGYGVACRQPDGAWELLS